MEFKYEQEEIQEIRVKVLGIEEPFCLSKSSLKNLNESSLSSPSEYITTHVLLLPPFSLSPTAQHNKLSFCLYPPSGPK